MSLNIGTEFLMGVAGGILKSEGIRWVIKNGELIYGIWCLITLILFCTFMFIGITFDPQDSWWAHKFFLWKLSALGNPFMGWILVIVWTFFYTILFEFIPFFFVLIPLAIFSLILWIVISIVGSLLVFLFGPLLIFAGGRLLFFHYAAMWLQSSDELEANEQAVMEVLSLGEGARHRMDGRAQLMGPGEFAEFQSRPQKGAATLVGKVNEEWFSYATEKHVLVVAGTRGGKGRDLIIPNLNLYPGSVFVLDPKGENAQRTLEQRLRFGPALVLDPFGVSGFPSARFNPLRYLTGDSMLTDAQTLADALIVGAEEDYFSSSARQLVFGLILYVATFPETRLLGADGRPMATPIRRDLPMLRQLLMRDLQGTLKAMVGNHAENAAARAVLADIGEWGLTTADREWSGIRNTAIEQTKWLNSPEMRAVLEDGEGQIDFSAFLSWVLSVYVCLPAPYFPTFNRWLRLVVATALDTLTKRLAPPDLPVRFVLDEVAQLGNLAKIESALTLSAGYGVQLWGIWQHIKDIERCYPRSGVGGWVSSSGLRLVFSVQDNETIRYFAGMTGQAMTETDLRHLEPGKLLCLIDGQNPLLVDRWPGPG